MSTPKTLDTATLLANLHWRYATKIFDPAKTIPADVWKALEETLVLTPSSFGLQPWKFLVITSPELKTRLKPHSWNQAQVTDCSHYVVFASKKKIGEADIDAFLARTAEVRGCTLDSLKAYRGMMVGDLVQGARSKVAAEWAVRQIYIALGNFMTAAALLQVDTCPMEGFVPAEYDKILGLEARGLTAAVCCAAGYRSETCKYAKLPKVRYKTADVIEHL
ncbi:MAG: NAD(P)H-dependent oxidoreductase [Methylacidiphilales bacterium]|nr:NAD(P)H-dependent oxidoreductase [Candidatus Methylacidiphilales bacterium]